MNVTEKRILHVFSAGVAKDIAQEKVDEFNSRHNDIEARLISAGSVELGKRIMSGERCDVFITADDSILTNMMMPEFVDGYVIFAGNKIVVQAIEDAYISDDTWEKVLLDENTTFKNKNPYLDPGGYRGVMALLLADNYKPGLSEKLMNHKGHFGMEKDSKDTPRDCDFIITYYTNAIKSGKPFACLPEVMDLSNPKLAKTYEKVSFAVDDNNVIKASPISHCITIPKAAQFKKEAQEFVKSFLDTDFSKYHFSSYREEKGQKLY